MSVPINAPLGLQRSWSRPTVILPAVSGAAGVPTCLMSVVVLHAFAGDRLYVAAGTGGRGFVSLTAAVIPCLVGLYAILAARTSMSQLVRSKGFWPSTGVMSTGTLVLPALGILVMDYPARSLFASTEGAIALSAVLCGYVLRARTTRAASLTAGLVAASCCVQLFASLSQAEMLANPVSAMFMAWDTSVRDDLGWDQVVAGRAIGTLVNPNTLGLAAVLGALFCGYFFRGWSRAVMFAICGLTLLLSQSRGALLALVVSTVVVRLMANTVRGRRGLGATAALLMIVGLAGVTLTTPLPQRVLASLQTVPAFDGWAQRTSSGLRSLSGSDEDANLASRLDAWQEAIAFSGQYPLGTFGPPQLLFVRSIDNDFIRLWCQGGVLLLGSFLLIVVSALTGGGTSAERRFATHAVVAVAVAAGSAVVLGAAPTVLMWLGVGMALRSPSSQPWTGAVAPSGGAAAKACSRYQAARSSRLSLRGSI